MHEIYMYCRLFCMKFSWIALENFITCIFYETLYVTIYCVIFTLHVNYMNKIKSRHSKIWHSYLEILKSFKNFEILKLRIIFSTTLEIMKLSLLHSLLITFFILLIIFSYLSHFRYIWRKSLITWNCSYLW